MFLDASVLMNVKADEHIAVFALSAEGPSVVECNRKMDTLVRDFSASLKKLGIADEDVTLDFITQNKTYGYEIDGKIAKEKLVGFDLKKNVSVRYKDKAPPRREGGKPRTVQKLDRFDIDYGLCMYCGICVDVCPFDALFWSPEYEYSAARIADLLHDKDRLGDWMKTVPEALPLEAGADAKKR